MARNPNDPALVYIRQCLAQGASYEVIGEQMIAHGYSPELVQNLIHEVMSEVTGRREGILLGSPSPLMGITRDEKPYLSETNTETSRLTTAVLAIRMHLAQGRNHQQIIELLQQDGYNSTEINGALDAFESENLAQQNPAGAMLAHRFQDMTPLRSTPTLFTLNGFGTTAYGRHDFDIETGTYVLTTFACAFFVPVIATASYRVADHPNGGWAFLGHVPMPKFWVRWNYAMLAVVPLLFMLFCGLGVGSRR